MSTDTWLRVGILLSLMIALVLYTINTIHLASDTVEMYDYLRANKKKMLAHEENVL